MSTCRIFVLGDPHIHPDDLDQWPEIVSDINALSPDAVLVVGDLTAGRTMGTHAGLAEALEVLSALKAPWETIIGNHDLQGKDFETDEAAVADFVKQVGRAEPWFAMDVGPLTVTGLSNTQWRRNRIQHNEIVLDEGQLTWWRQELARRADRPILVLCHAPPIGGGVLTLSELHCYTGNAVVNQNHNPSAVHKIVWEHPNILFWFSGHTHMGQHYRDTITMRLGVHFVHTGVAARRSSPDGRRHSRWLEIDEGSIRIRTFDHARRDFDPSLDHVEPYAVEALLAYRRRILGRRMVPRDPATMRQGPTGRDKPAGAVRFAFLSDVHAVEATRAYQQRLIDWCIAICRDEDVDRIVFGGDITHHADGSEARPLLAGLRRFEIDYLPGNNEGAGFMLGDVDPDRVRQRDALVEAGDDWPGRVFFVPSTDRRQFEVVLGELTGRLTAEDHVLVLSHFPPSVAGSELANRLENAPGEVTWICGHRHSAASERRGGLRIETCAGLDPIKVRGQGPELLLIDWDGREAAVRRMAVPGHVIRPARRVRHRLGLACRDEPTSLLRAAIERGIDAVQFHFNDVSDEATAAQREAMDAYRKKLPGGFASLYLPPVNDSADDGPDARAWEAWLDWAEAMGVDDLTADLPSVPAAMLFGEDEEMMDTTWAQRCREAYLELAGRALAMGAGLSLINGRNGTGPLAEGDLLLSSRPWHLTRMVEWLRSALAEKGHSASDLERIGIALDVGRAFRDASLSKTHGLAEWIAWASALLRTVHVHQVVRDRDSKTHDHRPIENVNGPMINYAGLLAAIEDLVARPIPLLIDLPDLADALRSREALKPIA